MKAWLNSFGGKNKATKQPITIQVSSKLSLKSKAANDGSMKRKKTKKGAGSKPKISPSTDSDSNFLNSSSPPNSSQGSEETKCSSPLKDPSNFGDWIKSAGIVSAVYVEPEVEDYEYGIFTFHFNSLYPSGNTCGGIPVPVVAKHMMDLQIFIKEEESLRFCKALAGEDSDLVTSAVVVTEAKNEGKDAKKYYRLMCKRYVKAVYEQEIEDILARSPSQSPQVCAPSRRPHDAWALGNTACTVQRKYSHIDQDSPEPSRAYSRQSSTTRDKVLHRIVSRVVSRVYSRQFSGQPTAVEEFTAPPAANPARRKSSVVTLKETAMMGKGRGKNSSDDELSIEQRKQVEDFLRDNGYDEY